MLANDTFLPVTNLRRSGAPGAGRLVTWLPRNLTAATSRNSFYVSRTTKSAQESPCVLFAYGEDGGCESESAEKAPFCMELRSEGAALI